MRKLLLVALLLCMGAVICGGPVATLAADKPVEISTCWMDESPGFNIWYAKKMGWDKEEGLDIKMLLFNSGPAQMEALPAKEWVLGSTGVGGQLIGGIRYNIYSVAPNISEGEVHVLYLRPDSPAAKVKGYNKDFPEVLGSPDTVKGKTFLTTTVSSAHYGLSSWLKVLGLTDKDITIKNMDQAQALAAFDNGIGDGVALWAPHMYAGQEKGWKIAGDLHMCKVGNPIVLIADTAYAEKNPEITAKFLSIYLRAVNMLQKEPLESLVPEYQRFFLEWAGKNYSPELSLTDLKTHPVYNLEEQLALFDTSKGMSTAQKWQSDIAKFFASVGSINKDELKKVENGAYATDKYLKLVKTPIPSYK